MALAIASRVTQRTVVRTALASRATDMARFYHGDQVPQAGNYHDYFVVCVGVAICRGQALQSSYFAGQAEAQKQCRAIDQRDSSY